MSIRSSMFAHTGGNGSIFGLIVGLIWSTLLLSACSSPPSSVSPKTDSSESQAAPTEKAATALPSPAATISSETPPHDANKDVSVSDAATAVVRNMAALSAIVPGIQGNYVDEKGVIVLDVFATGDSVKTAQSKQAEVERLLGHPVRMNFLDAPLVQQTGDPQQN
jgi:hypothetical protein